MTVTTLMYDKIMAGNQTLVDVLVDYDDASRDIGGTVTAAIGNPVVRELSAGGKAIGKPQPLAPYVGQGRQILLRNIAPADVLPLDVDGVPTKMAIVILWNR